MDVAEGLKEDWTKELISEKMLRADNVIPWMHGIVKPDKRRRRKRRKRGRGPDQVLITKL